MNNTLEILEVGMRDGLQNINTNLKIKDRIVLVNTFIEYFNLQLADPFKKNTRTQNNE